jgi:hypothetical protein
MMNESCPGRCLLPNLNVELLQWCRKAVDAVRLGVTKFNLLKDSMTALKPA